ncbi:hypothetical protein D3C84_837580 [compost metagenome]
MGQERLVGGDNHIGKGQQPCQHVILQGQVGAVLEKQLGLFLVHIQAQVAQLAAFQRLDQGRCVHQAAASGVDQHGAALHRSKRLGVDQVSALFIERAMQADDLRLREQLGQGQVAGAQGFDLWVGVGVVGQQLAAEAGHDPREGSADLPGADHSDGLAHQVEPG